VLPWASLEGSSDLSPEMPMRRSQLVLLGAMLCWLPSCDQQGSATDAAPAAGAAVTVLPCFPDGGKPVLEIRGIEINDATVHRLKRLKLSRNPSLSESYATTLAVEEAILPQALVYAMYRDRLPAMMERLAAVEERLAAGAPFAEVAAGLSEDPTSRAGGGDLGEMARKSPFNPQGMLESVEDVAFGLAVGERSGPFVSPLGIHILEVRREIPNAENPLLSKRQIAHILVAFDPDGLADGSFVPRLLRERRDARIRVLDPAWEASVPAVLRER
jgi:hypothetical protein